MSRHSRTRTRLARAVLGVVIVSTLAAGRIGRATARAGVPDLQRVPDAADQAVSAEVTIRRRDLLPAGAAVPASVSAMSLRFDRARGRGGWTTSLTLTGLEGADAPSRTGHVLENPFLVTRVEFDEGANAIRLFNRRGERVREPSGHERELFGARGGPDPFAGWVGGGRPSEAVAALGGDLWSADLTAPSLVERRRRALEASFGPPVERRQNVNRHAGRQGDQATEVLVDAASALPLEVRANRAGALVSRTTFAHEWNERGLLTRRRLHDERPVPGVNGRLAVLDIDVVRVSPAPGGGR